MYYALRFVLVEYSVCHEVIGRALYLFILYSMEKTNYGYSLKNIPVPSKRSYNLKLIEKIESVIKQMRWKTYFFLNGGKCQSDNKNTFEFRSRYHRPQKTGKI